METKPFDKEIWEQCDWPTKELVAKFLESTGKYILETPLEEQIEAFKQHDFRVIHKDSNLPVYIEVEQKLVWTKEHKWQGYPTLDVPYRKKDSKADLFIMVNRALNTLAVIPMHKIHRSITYRKNTKHNSGETQKERFFAVDLNDCVFFSVLENKIRKISPYGEVEKEYDWIMR